MNELALCIVNDGELYKRNCEIARLGPIARALEYREEIVKPYAAAYVKRFRVRPFGPNDISQAVAELDHYYQQHIKEI